MDVPHGRTWWSYGKGLLGPDASWAPVSGQTVLQTTEAVNNSGALSDPVESMPNADPTAAADAVDAAVRHGWLEEARVLGARRTSKPALRRACFVEESGAMANGEFRWSTSSTRVANGRHSCSTAGSTSWRSSTSRTTRVVEVAPLVKQRDEPGRAPAKPEIDATRPHQYVYMIRDLGAKRKPQASSPLARSPCS